MRARSAGHRAGYLALRDVLVGLVEAEEPRELPVEARFERADGHVAAVGGGVDAVVGTAAVEQVGRPPVLPGSGGQEAVDERAQVGDSVDDRGVDDLAAAGGTGRVQRGEDPGDEVEGAARVVAEQVGGRDGRALGRARHGEGPGEGEVADVVSGTGRQRPLLPPAGHPAVDQPRIAGETRLGADAETLGDAGPEALDQHVGPAGQAEDEPGGVRGLEVDQDGALVAVDDVRRGFQAGARSARPVHPDHVGAEVPQEHGGEGAGTDAAQLDHPHSGQGPAAPRRSTSCRRCCHRPP